VHDLGLFVEQIIYTFEVSNVQGAHSLDGRTKRVIGRTPAAQRPHRPSRGPQDTQDLRPINALPFTMLAEAHGRPSATLIGRSERPLRPRGRSFRQLRSLFKQPDHRLERLVLALQEISLSSGRDIPGPQPLEEIPFLCELFGCRLLWKLHRRR
jgi:hypothetical protein